MLTINWKESYSTRYNEDGKKWLHQDGLEYDLKGNAMDKKAVRKKVAEAADAAQAEANTAMAVAQGLQDQADAAQKLLDEPDSPQTVAALKDALDEMAVEYSSKDNKAALEELWVNAQAV